MWPQELTSSQSLLWGVGRRPQCHSSLAWDSRLVWVSDSEDAAPSPLSICPRCCPFNSPPPGRGPTRQQEDGWGGFSPNKRARGRTSSKLCPMLTT